jgi:hypothetical protein
MGDAELEVEVTIGLIFVPKCDKSGKNLKLRYPQEAC